MDDAGASTAFAYVDIHTYLVKRTGIHLDGYLRAGSNPVAIPHRLNQQPHKLRGAERRRAPTKKERLDAAAAAGVLHGIVAASSPSSR